MTSVGDQEQNFAVCQHLAQVKPYLYQSCQTKVLLGSNFGLDATFMGAIAVILMPCILFYPAKISVRCNNLPCKDIECKSLCHILYLQEAKRKNAAMLFLPECCSFIGRDQAEVSLPAALRFPSFK